MDLDVTKHCLVVHSDIWWWYGDERLFDTLPKTRMGLCALVTLLMPVSVFPMSTSELAIQFSPTAASHLHRSKKFTWQSENDPTYIDAIGIPRGVPDEYKLTNQVAAGFENFPLISALFPVTPNTNVDRINYIHYNMQ